MRWVWKWRIFLLVGIISIPTCMAQTWTKILDGGIRETLGFVYDSHSSLLVSRHLNPEGSGDELVRIDEDGTILQTYDTPVPVRAIVTNPMDSMEFYIGCIGAFDLPQNLFRTSDNGNSWINIGQTVFQTSDDWLSGFWVAPNNPNILLLGKSGLFSRINYRSMNKGDSWENITSLSFDQSFGYIIPSKTIEDRLIATTIDLNITSVCFFDEMGDSVYSIIDPSEYPLPVFPNPQAPFINGITNWGPDTSETYLVGAFAGNLGSCLLTLDCRESSNNWQILKTIDYDSLEVGMFVAQANQIYLSIFDDHIGRYGHLGVYGTLDGGVTWTFMDTSGLGSIDFGLSGSLMVDPREGNPFLYYLTPEGLYRATLPLSSGEDWVSVTQDEPLRQPRGFKVLSVYPNPFNPVTTIRYAIPENSQVIVTIYDQLGRKVKTLMNQTQSLGEYQLQWNGADDTGNQVGSGLYFCQVRVGGCSETIKMVYLR